jgi:EAL domain-containing protein (putative c-di-GMP-specific phosphodiesterase class I)
LLDRQLAPDVGRVLRRHGLPASSLVLEITETTMMSELEVVEEVFASLRRLGVRLSVDDFGTGYSSLALLQRVAVNEVKIDRSFVSNMLGSTSDLAIVRATVELAHNLGLKVVAEGVESAALGDALAALGCDLAQGYHLGVPVPASEVRAELSAAQSSGSTIGRVPDQRRPRLAVLGGKGSGAQ